MAFSPFGALSAISLDMATQNENILNTKLIQTIAKCYNKTPAQIVIRWGVQSYHCRCEIIFAKSFGENMEVFDFNLSQEEMQSISSLNQNRRLMIPETSSTSLFTINVNMLNIRLYISYLYMTFWFCESIWNIIKDCGNISHTWNEIS